MKKIQSEFFPIMFFAKNMFFAKKYIFFLIKELYNLFFFIFALRKVLSAGENSFFYFLFFFFLKWLRSNKCSIQWLYRWMMCVRPGDRKDACIQTILDSLHLILKFITFGIVGRARLHHGSISSSTFRRLFEAKWCLSALGKVRENRRDILGGKRHHKRHPTTCDLLHCAGNNIQDMAANNLTDTGLDFETLVNKFKRYFSSRNNVVFERYEFRRCAQEPGEGIDSWYTRLQMKVSTCKFETQTDSIIRDQIVASCLSNKLRRKLLQVSNISLEDTLTIGRSLETAHLQATGIEDESQETTLPPELAALRHSQ